MSTATNATSKPTPVRQTSFDADTVQALEKRLSQRPDKNELQDRNILKDDSVAPALQAAKERLQRSQLEDQLDQKIKTRPKPEEVLKKGILQDELPVATAKA